MKHIITRFFITFACVFSFSFSLHATISPNDISPHLPEVEFDLDQVNDTQFFMMDLDHFEDIVEGAFRPEGLPCQGVITSHYGWRKISRRRGRMHFGTDIAAPVGSPVYAPAHGKVVFSGRKNGYGLTIVIDHGEALTTLFAHNSELIVAEGQKVRKGDLIAKVGSTGRSTGPHLHYEVRVSGSPVNPSHFF